MNDLIILDRHPVNDNDLIVIPGTIAWLITQYVSDPISPYAAGRTAKQDRVA